ncbi:MAG: hypothetical protein R3A52_05530 [Polyangiales bacterium]
MAAPRSTLALSAFMALGTLGLAALVLTRGAGPRAVTDGACEVGSTHSVSADNAERAVSITDTPDGPVVLLVSQRAGHAVARALRVPAQGAPAELARAEADAPDSVSPLVDTPDGPAFATWRSGALTATVLASPRPRTVTFPRGESPPGRDAHPPSVSLALARDGALTALLLWPPPFGLRAVTARTTLESRDLLPRATATQRDPTLALTGDRVWVAMVETRAPSRADLVLASHPAEPFDASPPTVVRVAGLSPSATHLGLLTRASGSLVARWSEPDGPRYVEVAPAAAPSSPARVEGDPGAWAMVDHPRCGLVAAWFHDGQLGVAPLDDAHRARPAVIARARPGAVYLATSGERVALASTSDEGASLTEVLLDPTCAPTTRPVALPRSVTSGATRIVNLQGDADRVVLALSPSPADATTTELRFVTLDASGPRAYPAAATVPQGVGSMALLDPPTVMVSGANRGTIRLQRVGDVADDEPGEDLLLRDGHGLGEALLTSRARHRVWVAYTAPAGGSDPFHEPGGVVLQSAIDGLEDGPRVDVAAAPLPRERFTEATLHAIDAGDGGAARWGLTLGGRASSPDDPRPVGAFAAIYDSDFANSTTPTALVPEALADRSDRVRAAEWSGSRLRAVVTGPRVGARFVSADPSRGEARGEALDAVSPSAIAAPSMVPWGDDALVIWLDTTRADPALRLRRFGPDGAPRGPARSLGDVIGAPLPDVTLPVRRTTSGFVTVFPTRHGPRMARVRCGR